MKPLTSPILFLYNEESLVSSNLNSKSFRFHCVRLKVDSVQEVELKSLHVQIMVSFVTEFVI